jgi:predicted amidohydrolase YtcJ
MIKFNTSQDQVLAVLSLLFVSLSFNGPVLGQDRSNIPVQVIAWADTVLLNGKIVSMDNDGVNTDPGQIFQAMAVRDDEVLALGTNADIEAMAGPDTIRINLQGRTVIPGLIDTHSHLFEYASRGGGRPKPSGLAPSLPGWDRMQGQYETWEEIIPAILAEVKKRAEEQPAGTRIFFRIPDEGYLWKGKFLTSDPFVRYTLGLSLGDEEVLSEAQLRAKPLSIMKMDEIAPDHFVHVRFRNDGIGNSRMIKYIKNLNYGPVMDPGVIETEQTGLTSNSFNRIMTGEVFEPFMNQVKWYKQENQYVAAMGMTTFSSNVRSLTQVAAYQYLDAIGEIGIRFGFGPSSGTAPQILPSVLAAIGANFNPQEVRFGSKYMWYIGTGAKAIDSAFPHMTTSMEPPEISQDVKDREFSIDNVNDMLEIVDYYVEKGNRFTSTHIAGDGALDLVFKSLEEASTRGGISLEQIRAKRHAIDHCAMNPRPDQIEQLRHFNMIASCAPKYITNISDEVTRDYGEQYLKWSVPMRSLIDGGVRAVFEIDEPVTRGLFWYMDLMVNRQDINGNVWVPEERIDRVEALKTATIWATEYVGRKYDLGSLELGKLADYLILNKDYFTVPDRMIRTVRPLMTVVGGKAVYLDPDFASEIGSEPVGLQPIFALEHIAIWEAEAAAAGGN